MTSHVRPTSRQFFDAHTALSNATLAAGKASSYLIEKPQAVVAESVKSWSAHPTNPLSNLLAQHIPRTQESNPEVVIQRQIESIERTIDTDPAIAWVRAQIPFQKLMASRCRKAKSSPDSKWSSPSAPYRLLECTLVALSLHSNYVEHRGKPGQMARGRQGIHTPEDTMEQVDANAAAKGIDAVEAALRAWDATQGH